MVKILGLRRRTSQAPVVVVPFLQFPVDELGASADERHEPVAVEPSPGHCQVDGAGVFGCLAVEGRTGFVEATPSSL